MLQAEVAHRLAIMAGPPYHVVLVWGMFVHTLGLESLGLFAFRSLQEARLQGVKERGIKGERVCSSVSMNRGLLAGRAC